MTTSGSAPQVPDIMPAPANVYPIGIDYKNETSEMQQRKFDTGGGPPDDGDMEHLEKRVDKIEDRLGRIEGDVSSMKTSLASIDAKMDIASIRASVERAHTEIYKWIASIVIGVIGLGSAVYFGLQKIAPPAPQPPYIQSAPATAPAPAPAPMTNSPGQR